MLYASDLSTTPTQSLIEPPQRMECLAMLQEYRRKVSFPMTQQYNAQFRNRTESRQPY